MPNLSVFSFESHEIRFVGTSEEPWWVAVDVCRILDIQNPTQAMEKLDDDEKAMLNIGQGAKSVSVNVINESGLYSLVLTSRKAQAKRFKKWLTSEVIPTIRKTGSYGEIAKQAPQQERLQALDTHILSISDEIKAHESAVRTLRIELQDLKQVRLNEAVAFLKAYPDLGETYIHCKEILKESNNPYLSVGSSTLR